LAQAAPPQEDPRHVQVEHLVRRQQDADPACVDGWAFYSKHSKLSGDYGANSNDGEGSLVCGAPRYNHQDHQGQEWDLYLLQFVEEQPLDVQEDWHYQPAGLHGGLQYGKQHNSCNTKEKLLKTCQSFHFLFEDKDSKYGVPFCHYNPASLTCPSCKGFKHVGICSHILAFNHMLGLVDVHYLMGKVQKPKKIGGQKRNVRPALQCESDSSEDDAPNLLQT
jgi:hypothetical protein